MSWFEGLAQEFNDQVNRAAASVQRLSEQADIQQLGERVRTSVLSGVSGLGLLPDQPGGAGEATEEELSRSFLAEACALKDAPGGPPSADVEATLRRWALRLEGKVADGPTALVALLRSRALTIALRALARCKAGRHAIRAASGSAGVEEVPGSTKGEAGAHLRAVLARASAAPWPMLERLLGLLADAGKAAVKVRRVEGTGKQAAGPDQNLQWVLALVSAVLVDVSEVAVRETAGRAEALDTALGAAATAAAACASAPPAAAASAAAAPLTEGAAVWAEWPGDGRWYHAFVSSAAPDAEEVEVEWTRPPDDVECGRDVEYLENILGEASVAADPEAQRTRLPVASVLPGDQERPLPAVPVGEESWTQQLDSAEALSRSFQELKTFCEDLAGAPKQSPAGAETAGQALAATADSLAALRTEHGPRPVEVVEAREPAETGSASLDEEIEGLRVRAEELSAERAQVLERLKAIGEEQAAVAASLARAERRLHGGGSPGGEAGEDKQETLAAEAGAASLEIEALLATRARAAAAAGTALDNRLPGAQSGCLRAERARRRRFEDLLSGLHAAIWGPEAPAFARDPAAVAAARSILNRAGSLVEQAWREMVQLAAETLGDGGALSASSEEMSRAAKRYKEMRKEMAVNLDRLAKLEASVGGAPAAPAPPAASAPPAAGPSPAETPATAAAQAAEPTPAPPAAAKAQEAPEAPASPAAAAAEAPKAGEPAVEPEAAEASTAADPTAELEAPVAEKAPAGGAEEKAPAAAQAPGA